MLELANELIEVICDKPLIWPNWRSRGVVTDEAITSGPAPGNCPVTWMVGKSTDGSAETGSRRYPSRPMSTTPAISSEVAIGRWMKGSERLMEFTTYDLRFAHCEWTRFESTQRR